jgi:hypothetical protein
MTVKEISEISGLSAGALALVREDSTSASYLDSLEKQELFDDAVRFLAYKLPTDAGIKWASGCVRELQSPESRQQKDEPLEASDRWVKAPGDPTRWAAKEAVDKAKTAGPSKLVAMAVFLSGGSVSPPGAPETPPPPNVAQKMVAGSIQVAVVGYDAKNAKDRYKKALTMGKALDQPGS